MAADQYYQVSPFLMFSEGVHLWSQSLDQAPEAHNFAKATFVYFVISTTYWSKLTLKKSVRILPSS